MVPAMILETGRTTDAKTAASLLGQRKRCCDHESRPRGEFVLDDRTLTYFIGANKRFYLLRKLLVEMAGLLLLDTVGVRHDQYADGIEQQISRDLAEAADLTGASPPNPVPICTIICNKRRSIWPRLGAIWRRGCYWGAAWVLPMQRLKPPARNCVWRRPCCRGGHGRSGRFLLLCCHRLKSTKGNIHGALFHLGG